MDHQGFEDKKAAFEQRKAELEGRKQRVQGLDGEEQHRILTPLKVIIAGLLAVALFIPHLANRHEVTPTVWPDMMAGWDMTGPGLSEPRSVHNRSNWATADMDLDKLKAALEQFHRDCGRYPTYEEGLNALTTVPDAWTIVDGLLLDWHGPYLPNQLTTDPWNVPYRYRTMGSDEYTLGVEDEEGQVHDFSPGRPAHRGN